MTAPDQVSPTAPDTAPVQKKSWKQRLLLWTLGILGVLLVLFFAYRWAGTSTYRGSIQRVYETNHDFRTELVDLDGNVHVLGNQEIKFPYFKLDTADLHAKLNRLAQTRDIVDVKVWGFRMSWFSTFPNLIDVEFVVSRQERNRKRAEDAADAVIRNLQDRGFLKAGDNVRDDLVQIIAATLDEQPH